MGSVKVRVKGRMKTIIPISFPDIPSASISGSHLTLGLFVKVLILTVRR